MATVTFTAYLKDHMSSGLNKLSQTGVSSFNKLSGSMSNFQTKVFTTKSSISQLNSKIDELKRTRDLSIDTRAIRKANREIEQLENKMNKLETKGRKDAGGGSGMGFGGFGLSGGMLLAGAAAGAGALTLSVVKMSASMEQSKVAFEVMLGSTEKATYMLGNLKRMADKTPFEFIDLQDASKTLLQFGLEGQKVMPTIKMLGDVAGGDSEKLKSLALVFGQVNSAGRLMGQDLLQFINVGFNPLQEISKRTGKSMAQLKQEMEKGGISSQMVTQAFVDATSQGGRFFGMMDKQSQTTAGRWSTLMDNLKSVGMTVGDAMLPAINKVMDRISQAIAWVKGNFASLKEVFAPLIDAIRPLWEAFGYLADKMGITGSTGGFLSKVFNLLGGLFKLIAPFIKVSAIMTGVLIKTIAVLADWAMRAFSWISKLFGFKDKKFKDNKQLDVEAQLKEAEAAKKDPFAALDKNKSAAPGVMAPSTPLGSGIGTITGDKAQSKNINMVIHNLVEKLSVNTTNLTESALKIRDIIKQELLTAVNDANYALE